MSSKDEIEISPVSTQGSVPSIEKEVLIEKLQNVPEEVLRSILTNQVDLEIRLKHKELKLTEEEIGKCEAQMLALRKFFEVPNELSFRNEPNDFTLKYFDILNKSLSVNYTKLQQLQYSQEHPIFKETMFMESEPATHSYRTRSTTSSLRPSVGGPAVRIAGCLYRRTDGVIVKLTCPDCQRSNFSSAQGFLNHNRIAHSKEYASQDAAALRCGDVLPNEFQDEEGLASLASMNQRGINPSRNLNTNDGCYDGMNTSGNKSDRLSNSCVETNVKSSVKKLTPEPLRDCEFGSEDARAIVRDSINDGIGTQELMKKLISRGVARDARDFKSLIGEIQKEIPNAHLFADEEDVDEDANENTDSPAEPEKAQCESVVEQPLRGKNATNPRSNDGEVGLRAGTPAHSGERKESDSQARPETGGKYENRLRRRKSRAEMSLSGTEDGDETKVSEERRSKRKKSQR
ncbi:hypothetical protein JCM33374_g1162 [Metschnikowia sp. JCM 33374]|nr:hypothetical protein JCM33374_g1162 [Metschnikowia sp. JCM 33374]